jgi:elongation factor P
MLSLNELKTGTVIRIANEPYVIVKAEHHKMGRGGAVLKTKMRNLINGNMLEKTFQGNDKAEEAETQKKKANYLYKDDNNANFMDNESYEQFGLSLESIGDKIKFLKDDTDVDVFYFDGNPVSVQLPVKIELKVTSAPPGVKGNSAGNVTKVVELETGAEINVPMFINEGDVIRINTESEEYVERVN